MKADPFGPNRKRLLGLAYRMLGSRAEAEDVLQDAWLRFNAVREVGNRDALLTTIVTRLCLDRLKSARARREVYVGPWLPEPVMDGDALSPDTATELADDLSFALLLALELLSTEQMARLEREMASLNDDYKELEISYGDDMLVLVVASGFLERLLSKPEIERFLETKHPEFSENFRAIVQATSLDHASTSA